MKRIVAFILVLVLTLSLTACVKDDSPLAGSWQGEVDMTDAFNSFLQKYTEDNADIIPQEKISQLKRDMVVDNCTLVVDIEFKRGKMTVDTRFKNSAALLEQVRPGWNNIMNEILVIFGMTEDEGADMLTGLFDFEGFYKNVTGEVAKKISGKYTVEGDKLILDGTEFGTFTTEGDTLNITLTDAASDMYKSETYYVITMNKNWTLERM